MASAAASSLNVVGPFNLDSRQGLRAAVAARAVRGEIATWSSDQRGLPAAANMALQLQRFGLSQHVVLADAEATCVTGQSHWPWLGCGWSSGLPGFEEKYAAGHGGETAKLWSLWSAKWLLVARLVELRVNVLALDTDMMLQADPYPLLHSEPISRFEIVIVPEGSRVNLGFLYALPCRPSIVTAPHIPQSHSQRLPVCGEAEHAPPMVSSVQRPLFSLTAGLASLLAFTGTCAAGAARRRAAPCRRCGTWCAGCASSPRPGP